MSPRLTDGEVRDLEAAVDQALRTGQTTDLKLLGYGEISCVVAWPSAAGELACKRLPPFQDERRVRRYAATVDAYVERLAAAGLRPLDTTVQWLERDDGLWIAYCVQPISAAESLAHVHLARCAEAEAADLLGRLLGLLDGCVSDRLGLDGQISNWVVTPEGCAYLDVTTPLMRDDRGREQLDTDLFISSLPWALRGVVRRLMLHQILDKYYQLRGVVLDILGNFHKEGLERLIPPLLSLANERLSPPITADEVRRYYDEDARMWALLQRLRIMDRAWQRHVLRRTYPFLLPGRIDRNLR